jgi:hypothetical protein
MKLGDLVREKSQWMLIDNVKRRARGQIGVAVKIVQRRTDLGDFRVQCDIKWLQARRDGRTWFTLDELEVIV